MDFSFINSLMEIFSQNKLFKFTFIGFKTLAFAILIFKVLEIFIKDSEGADPKLGNILSILGYGCVIMSSDWIIIEIENAFTIVDTTIKMTPSNLYEELSTLVDDRYKLMFKEAEDPFDYMGVWFSGLPAIISLIFTYAIGGLCKLADMSITASYLIQRVFIIELLKLLFPLAIALSTYSGTQKLFHTWILRYIGVFILGIAYIGIIHISSLVQIVLLNEFGSDLGGFSEGSTFAGGILITMVVVFIVKVKLFAMVTNYVMGMFQ